MGRPKKERPNRSDDRFEIKITIGHDITGRPIRKSFYSPVSLSDARSKANSYKLANEAARFSRTPLLKKDMAFSEWACIWLKKYKLNNVKENTYKNTYEHTVTSYLLPYFGQSSLQSILPADIQGFYTAMAAKYHKSTLHKMKLCLNAIFNTAIDNDICYKNPAKNIKYKVKKVSRKKRTYTQAEVDTILRFSDTHEYGMYIRILLELGLRCSELLGLKWSDINFEAKTLFIQRACTTIDGVTVVDKPKSASSIRVLPVSGPLYEALKSQKGSSEDFILHTKNKKPYSYAHFISKIYYKFLDAFLASDEGQGFERLTPHELRHTCGTLLYAKSQDIFAVSKYLGHSNLDITSKLYVHEDAEILRKNLGIN